MEQIRIEETRWLSALTQPLQDIINNFERRLIEVCETALGHKESSVQTTKHPNATYLNLTPSEERGAVKPSAAVATVKPRLSRQIDEIEETSQEETADSKDEVVKEKKKESQIIGAVKPSAAVATVKPVSRQKEETEKKSQEETADSKDEVLKEKKKEIQITERRKGREKEKRDDGKNNSCDDDVPRPKGNRKSWGIRKDDEFFHFIIICFAVGASLISSYNYADWTVSAGIGLMVFASLETIGIYFGLIQRIRTAVEAFLPLLSKSPFTGFRKNQ